MRNGDNRWWRLVSGGGRLDVGTRPARALRPGGADLGAGRPDQLEPRRLMTAAPVATAVRLVPVTAPSVVQTGQDITASKDGDVWFTEPGIGQIGRINPQGIVTSFPLPAGHQAASGITGGPDGNVWFTENGSVGKITPTGVVTEYPVAAGANLTGITGGPDGNVWFMDTDQGKIGRITPTGTVTLFTIPNAVALKSQSLTTFTQDITSGPDGNLWYSAEGVNPKSGQLVGEIGKVTTSGAVTVYRLTSGGSGKLGNSSVIVTSITGGPDGNVWFTDNIIGGAAGIGRITPAGKITQFSIPNTPAGTHPSDIATDITAAADGNLWFNLQTDNFTTGPSPEPYIGRITPTGKITISIIPNMNTAQKPSIADGAEYMTSGPGGYLYLTGSTRNFYSPTGRLIGVVSPFTSIVAATTNTAVKKS